MFVKLRFTCFLTLPSYESGLYVVDYDTKEVPGAHFSKTTAVCPHPQCLQLTQGSRHRHEESVGGPCSEGGIVATVAWEPIPLVGIVEQP